MYYSGRMFDNDIILSIDSAWRYQKKFKPIVGDCLFYRFFSANVKMEYFYVKTASDLRILTPYIRLKISLLTFINTRYWCASIA